MHDGAASGKQKAGASTGESNDLIGAWVRGSNGATASRREGASLSTPPSGLSFGLVPRVRSCEHCSWRSFCFMAR